MNLDNSFNKSDVIKSFNWLGHQELGYTELLALHPAYKPGKDNYEHNVQNNAFPKMWYAKEENHILNFLSKYHGSHMCCFGVNPRPKILQNQNGYLRRACEDDIEIINNFYLDIDFKDGLNNEKQLKTLNEFLVEIDDYLTKKGINKPVRAFSGNGYHLLFALRPIQKAEHDDIGDRLNAFLNEVNDKFITDMENIGVKIDKTTDLVRTAKIYGTAKPGSDKISKFYCNERIEDKLFADYLMSLPIDTIPYGNRVSDNGINISLYKSIPKKFQKLIENDPNIADLWKGINKDSGDTTRTGYDMSLIHACIRNGITDVKALATLLAMRPNGAVLGSGKGDDYIRVTIANALQNSSW